MLCSGLSTSNPSFPLASLCLSVRTHEWTLVGYFKFPKFLFPKPKHLNSFFKFIVLKKHLRNKPHLHIKGANKLKMRFIPYNFSEIC